MKTILFTSLLCALVLPGQAGLLSYEGFNYAPGTPLTGKDPDAATGANEWSSPWSGSSDKVQTAPQSLPLPKGAPPATGGSARISASGGGGTITYDPAFSFDFTKDGVAYASVLFRKPDIAKDNENLQLNLGSVNGKECWVFGIGSDESFFVRSWDTATNSPAAFNSAAGTAKPDTTYLLVCKLVTSATGDDCISLTWYEADVDTVPALEPETWLLNRYFANKGGSQAFALTLSCGKNVTSAQTDEIRLGTDWASVATKR